MLGLYVRIRPLEIKFWSLEVVDLVCSSGTSAELTESFCMRIWVLTCLLCGWNQAYTSRLLFIGLIRKWMADLAWYWYYSSVFALLVIFLGWKILVSKWISFICRACDPRLQYEREQSNELVQTSDPAQLSVLNELFSISKNYFPERVVTSWYGKGPVHHFMTPGRLKRQENSTTFYCWRKMMKYLKYSPSSKKMH